MLKKNEGMSLIVNDRIIQILGHDHKKGNSNIYLFCLEIYQSYFFFFFDKNYQSYLS
jgi:hypothetical protein